MARSSVNTGAVGCNDVDACARRPAGDISHAVKTATAIRCPVFIALRKASTKSVKVDVVLRWSICGGITRLMRAVDERWTSVVCGATRSNADASDDARPPPDTVRPTNR